MDASVGMGSVSESWQAGRALQTIQAQPITPEAFGRYGDVLVPPAKFSRVDFLADFTNARAAARVNIAMVRSERITAPIRVAEMERHPFSAQVFIPVDVGSYLVVVAEDDGDGGPDLGTLAAFRVEHPAGIGYRAGVWHINMGGAIWRRHLCPANPRGRLARRLPLQGRRAL